MSGAARKLQRAAKHNPAPAPRIQLDVTDCLTLLKCGTFIKAIGKSDMGGELSPWGTAAGEALMTYAKDWAFDTLCVPESWEFRFAYQVTHELLRQLLTVNEFADTFQEGVQGTIAAVQALTTKMDRMLA